MNRALFACCALAIACARAPNRAPARPIAAGLLRIAHATPAQVRSANAELERLAATVKRELARGTSPAVALARSVFERKGFTREVDDTALEFVFLPSVLQTKRGSCVGLGGVYLALGERLGLRIRGVMVPGHFFVQLEDSRGRHDLELLHRGEEMPDAWYKTRFPTPSAGAHEYGRRLEPREVLGVIEYDVGNQRKREGRLREARAAYASARDDFPEFAEAHASLGAIEQLLGALDAAYEAYRAAQALNPSLPGLAHNLELLEAERKTRSQL